MTIRQGMHDAWADSHDSTVNVHGALPLQDGQLRLMYRHSPGSTVHCFKGSCVLPAPMEVRGAEAVALRGTQQWETCGDSQTVLHCCKS